MGFKRKFEIGDKVRVIDPSYDKYKKIGKIISYLSNYNYKGLYEVKFEDGTYFNYKPNKLELVEANISCNISPKKLSISDLRPGMKVRIRSDLKEGYNPLIYVSNSMTYFKGTIQTIKTINSNNTIILNSLNYLWDIDCFSEIVEESKEEIKTSEHIKFPLKEGQIVTLLDGKKYQVINKKDFGRCALCSLGFKGSNNCSICYINGIVGCPNILPKFHYFKLIEDNKKENKSFSKPLTISDFKVGMRVRVKEDFDKIMTGPDYISNISTKMRTFKGKELIIENIGNNYIIAKNYCWIPEWLEIIDESTTSSNSIENSSVKETGIITKVNFTLTDFKSEKLEHSKFTVL